MNPSKGTEKEIDKSGFDVPNSYRRQGAGTTHSKQDAKVSTQSSSRSEIPQKEAQFADVCRVKMLEIGLCKNCGHHELSHLNSDGYLGEAICTSTYTKSGHICGCKKFERSLR